MKLVTVAIVLVAAVLGVFVGHLWWGRPAAQLDTELRETRSQADKLGQEVEALRVSNKQLKEQLSTAQQELGTARDMNMRLHKVISENRK
jgi:hypothetical protein